MDAQKLHFLLAAARLLVCLLRDRSLHLKKVTSRNSIGCPHIMFPAPQSPDASCETEGMSTSSCV